jgi:hypothetical protein
LGEKNILNLRAKKYHSETPHLLVGWKVGLLVRVLYVIPVCIPVFHWFGQDGLTCITQIVSFHWSPVTVWLAVYLRLKCGGLTEAGSKSRERPLSALFGYHIPDVEKKKAIVRVKYASFFPRLFLLCLHAIEEVSVVVSRLA